MHIQKMKLLTGTMLSLLLSGVSVYPAVARPTGKVEAGSVISQTNTIPTSPSNTSPSNTSPSDTSPSNTSPSNTSPTTSSAQTIRGTVKSVTGDVVTMQLPDGTTRDVTLQPGDVARLKLKPGAKVAVTLDDQNAVTKVSVIRSTTTTTTTSTTTQRRTVQAKPASTQQQSTQSSPAQSNTPVRGLW